MPTTANSITYFVAADGTLRDGQQGSIAQTPRINYGTEYAVTLSFPPSTIAEGDQLQVALNRTRTFFSSASATGDAPVAAVVKHDVTAAEAAAQEVAVVLSTNTRAMIDQVNGIDHPVRGFFGVHVLRGQSFVTLAVSDALMMSLESGPDAISPSLPVMDYPTREEAEALTERSENAAERAEEAAAGIVPPLQLSSPPTTSTSGSVGQLAVWHDATTNKDHIYHLCFVSEGESATLYHWEECVLVSMGNVAGGYPVLDSNGKVAAAQLPDIDNTLILNTAPTTVTVGKVGQRALDTTAQKTYTCTAVTVDDTDPNNVVTTYTWKEGVFLDANGYVSNTLIRKARAAYNDENAYGLVRFWTYGVSVSSNGYVRIVPPNNAKIDAKTDDYNPITSINLNYAVRSVLPNVTEIPAATSDYSLVDSSATTNNHSHVYSHAPTTAPTYRLPSVSDTTVSHYIELTVDFTNVQTYSFLDANGDALIPLFTPSIAVGDVYTFRMEYSAIKAKWLIYPQKQGAVADDFVMRGEVGAANGVAGLDANAKVPRTNLPVFDYDQVGVLRIGMSQGFRMSNNYLVLHPAENIPINNRRNNSNGNGAIMPSNLNYAVTAALTDSNKISLTDAQKAAAQSVFGIGGPITEIPAETSEYTLLEGIFKHAPTNAPTYNLPAITDTIRSHVIVLAIDFSSVQTFSFVPPQDSGVTFQSYANPNQGDVWVFRCVWYGGKWRIAPMKIKNCVTRQLTGGSLAITDAVGGNALALKMVAPRSVVVNQLVQNGDFSDGTTGWGSNHVLVSASDDIAVLTASNTPGGLGTNFISNPPLTTIAGHVGLISARFNTSVSHGVRIGLGNADAEITDIITIEANKWTMLSFKGTFAANKFRAFIYPFARGSWVDGDTVSIQQVQVVDLTQYFNGDQTLIDSIQSWDDLVAYDPRFASYVEYNTGEVRGITPSVKVLGKNLINWNGGGPYTNQTTISITDTPLPAGIYTLSVLISETNLTSGTVNIRLKFKYSDGISRQTDLIEKAGGTSGVVSRAFTFSKPFIVTGFTVAGSKSGYSVSVSNIQIELGSTATSYEPYHDGVTATAPSELFAVGNAADEYEAVSGVTMRKLVEYVVTGSESYTIASESYIKSDACDAFFNAPLDILQIDNTISIISNKFVTTTNMWSKTGYPNTVCQNLRQIHINIANSLLGITDYTQETRDTAKAKIIAYLQAQYNAGTPLIVYYPLKAPTTSISTPTTISLQAGNNVAMQTDGGRLAPIDITYESNEI